jgi:hypothetical protein
MQNVARRIRGINIEMLCDVRLRGRQKAKAKKGGCQ